MKFRVITTQLLTVISLATFAQKEYIYQNQNGAIKGYDPVAYFNEGSAVKGAEAFSYEWKEAMWYFSSKENLELFKGNPEKYSPQYGGYCSYAVAKGYTAKIDPTSWKIIDGKLYLSYNESIKKNWEAYQDKYIKNADTNWPSVLDENQD